MATSRRSHLQPEGEGTKESHPGRTGLHFVAYFLLLRFSPWTPSPVTTLYQISPSRKGAVSDPYFPCHFHFCVVSLHDPAKHTISDAPCTYLASIAIAHWVVDLFFNIVNEHLSNEKRYHSDRSSSPTPGVFSRNFIRHETLGRHERRMPTTRIN